MGLDLPHGWVESVIFLCRIDEIAADPGTKNVVLGEGDDQLDIIIVQTNGARHAYVNSCPHQFIPLETFPNHFLTADKKFLVCSGHGARFARLPPDSASMGPVSAKGARTDALPHFPKRKARSIHGGRSLTN